MLGRISRTVAGLLTLPPALAHEAVHAAAAAPWADRLAVVIDAQGLDAAVGVEWTADEPPTHAKWLAAYAPLLLGILVGIGGGVRLLSGGVPREPTSRLTLGVLAIWWAVFVWPSADDRERASEARDDTSSESDPQ